VYAFEHAVFIDFISDILDDYTKIRLYYLLYCFTIIADDRNGA